MKFKNLFIAFCVIMHFSTFAQIKNETQSKPKIKYIFFMIGDGMSLSQVEATDLYLKSKLPNSNGLFLKNIPLVSIVSTKAYNHPITCSAAAGTALATGNKTSLGTIGMNFDHTKNFQTIAEYAREKGYKVGILTSVYINHATPAAFYAKVGGRNDYHEIGMQLVRSKFNYFAGGIIEKSEGDTNVYDYAAKNNYKIVKTRKDFDALKLDNSKVIIGSNELNGSENIENLIDRKAGTVCLADYLQKGIDLLQNETGFFIMCEGGKIDWACHANDFGSMVGEVQDFDKAIKTAFDFYTKHPDETLILITGDHETGGLAMGNSFMGYEVNPAVVDSQKISGEKFGAIISEMKKQSKTVTYETVLDTVKKYFSLGNGITLTSYDSERLEKAYKVFFELTSISPEEKKNLYSDYNPVAVTCTKLIAEKAGFGWTTFHHTGIPLPLRAIGKGSELLKELTDNTEISKVLFECVKK